MNEKRNKKNQMKIKTRSQLILSGATYNLKYLLI